MTDVTKPAPEPEPFDVSAWATAMTGFAQRSWRLWSESLADQKPEGTLQIPDPGVVSKTFLEMATRLQADPAKLFALQVELWSEWSRLWQAAARRAAVETVEPVAQPDEHDRRFKDKAWEEEFYFDVVKQAFPGTEIPWKTGTRKKGPF